MSSPAPPNLAQVVIEALIARRQQEEWKKKLEDRMADRWTGLKSGTAPAGVTRTRRNLASVQ